MQLCFELLKPLNNKWRLKTPKQFYWQLYGKNELLLAFSLAKFARNWTNPKIVSRFFSTLGKLFGITTDMTVIWYITRPIPMIICGIWFQEDNKKTKTHRKTKFLCIFQIFGTKIIWKTNLMQPQEKTGEFNNAFYFINWNKTFN